MLKSALFHCSAAAAIIATAAAFAPTRRENVRPPDLCAVANRLNEDALTRICGDIKYLGHGTFNELNLIPPQWNVLNAISTQAEGREELAAPRHFFEYEHFVITVRTDSVQHLDMVLRSAEALNRIKVSGNDAYRFIRSTMQYPTAPTMADTLWKRRFERVIISFDKTPQSIAAGATLLGKYDLEGGTRLYNDYAIISIDEVTILGATQGAGSRPIYGLPSAAENYRAYMGDGLIYSIVHEAAHRYVDHLRGTNRLANSIYNSRFTDGTNADEVVANETAIFLVGDMLSSSVHRHVMQLNTGFARSAATRQWLSRWNVLSGRSRSHLVVPDVTLVP